MINEEKLASMTLKERIERFERYETCYLESFLIMTLRKLLNFSYLLMTVC